MITYLKLKRDTFVVPEKTFWVCVLSAMFLSGQIFCEGWVKTSVAGSCTIKLEIFSKTKVKSITLTTRPQYPVFIHVFMVFHY